MTNDATVTSMSEQQNMGDATTLRYFTEIRQQEPEYEYNLIFFMEKGVLTPKDRKMDPLKWSPRRVFHRIIA
jgi:hypothetical protein